MGLDDKIANAAEGLGGKAKQATGGATGDRELEAEGRGDQKKADLKQAGEKVKDAFRKD
ncbi:MULTISPECIES: CsbD family protein [unclassified Actinotalea]|uniref:CsbD family protein n=1 Tax=unclassified Actinotalea TaxID=2638618 RepID=UPI0015F3D332|nr:MULTISPECIES: CsbD family protein [unclassified Actinotalea]